MHERTHIQGYPIYARPLAMGLAFMMSAMLVACSRDSDSGAKNDTGTGAMHLSASRQSETAEQALERHAQKLWQARLDEDWATVFAYDPSSERGDVTAEQYAAWAQAGEPFRIHTFEIKSIAVEPEWGAESWGWVELTSSVSMRKYPNVPPRETSRFEKWRRTDGGGAQPEWKPLPPNAQEDVPIAPMQRDIAAERQLAARFDAACAARIQRDWDALYAMTDPQDRAGVDQEQFQKVQEATSLISYKLHWVEVVGDRGTVRVEVTYKLTDPSLTKLPPKADLASESWVKRDGEWYLKLAPSAE